MKKVTTILIALFLALTVCSCSGSKGPETPDFETDGIQWISASSAMQGGQKQPFATICEKDRSQVTRAEVNIYSQACDAPEGFSTPDGYAWQRLTVRLAFGDEAANENGYRYCYFLTDYYDMDGLQGSLSYDEGKQCDTFTVRYNDKKYKKCIALISKSAEDWVMDEESGLQHCSELLNWTLMLPEGYDGICCGIYDAALEGQVDTAADFREHYDPASFLIYRLDAVR